MLAVLKMQGSCGQICGTVGFAGFWVFSICVVGWFLEGGGGGGQKVGIKIAEGHHMRYFTHPYVVACSDIEFAS
jgi:hypothetical protein